MINSRLINFFVFFYLGLFNIGILPAQNNSEESDYERRLRMAEEFLKRTSNKSFIEADSMKENKEIKEEQLDKEKKNTDQIKESNEASQQKKSWFPKLKPSIKALTKKKNILYGAAAVGTLAILLMKEDSATNILVNEPINGIGPPPDWPNGP